MDLRWKIIRVPLLIGLICGCFLIWVLLPLPTKEPPKIEVLNIIDKFTIDRLNAENAKLQHETLELKKQRDLALSNNATLLETISTINRTLRQSVRGDTVRSKRPQTQ
jgi:hypothetical protein